jgi:hypothetical protein
MKPDEKVIAKISRVELDDKNDKVYIVFEVTDPSFKVRIKKNWIEDIEFKIINKELVEV